MVYLLLNPTAVERGITLKGVYECQHGSINFARWVSKIKVSYVRDTALVSSQVGKKKLKIKHFNETNFSCKYKGMDASGELWSLHRLNILNINIAAQF